jgi:hypothetical protein
MSRMHCTLALCALAVALTSGTVAAQQQQPPPRPAAKVEQKAQPSVWDQTKDMTRKEWNSAKKKWAQEKVKWNDCNRQSRQEKLEAPKSWSFIASCMTKT